MPCRSVRESNRQFRRSYIVVSHRHDFKRIDLLCRSADRAPATSALDRVVASGKRLLLLFRWKDKSKLPFLFLCEIWACNPKCQVKGVNEQINQELRLPEREEWGSAMDVPPFPALLPLHRGPGCTCPWGPLSHSPQGHIPAGQAKASRVASSLGRRWQELPGERRVYWTRGWGDHMQRCCWTAEHRKARQAWKMAFVTPWALDPAVPEPSVWEPNSTHPIISLIGGTNWPWFGGAARFFRQSRSACSSFVGL